MKIDIIGKRFGRWTALSFVRDLDPPRKRVVCVCDCGTKKPILPHDLIHGVSKSCGCLRDEIARRQHTVHGYSSNGKSKPIYEVWASMKGRCRSDRPRLSKNYKSRGIKVCQRWLTFQNFLDDMEATYRHGLTIERVDNNRGYCKENCIWAPMKVQCMNKTTSVKITANGETLNAITWAKRLGGSKNLIYARLEKGWTPEMAVTTPLQVHVSRIRR